jgi:hypothetical protein
VSARTLVAQTDASRPRNDDDDMIGSFPPDGSAAAASDGTCSSAELKPCPPLDCEGRSHLLQLRTGQ